MVNKKTLLLRILHWLRIHKTQEEQIPLEENKRQKAGPSSAAKERSSKEGNKSKAGTTAWMRNDVSCITRATERHSI